MKLTRPACRRYLTSILVAAFTSCATTTDAPEDTPSAQEDSDEVTVADDGEVTTDADQAATLAETQPVPSTEEMAAELGTGDALQESVDLTASAEPIEPVLPADTALETAVQEAASVPPATEAQVPSIAELVTESTSPEVPPEQAPIAQVPVENEVSAVPMDVRRPSQNESVYIVQPGDTLGMISEKIYGTPARWQQLAERNSIANPRRLLPGDLVVFAKSSKLSRQFAASQAALPRDSVRVARGESLTSIAKRVLGSEREWRVLWAYNRKTVANPDRLFVGTRLEYVSLSKPEAAVAPVPEEQSTTVEVKQADAEPAKEEATAPVQPAEEQATGVAPEASPAVDAH